MNEYYCTNCGAVLNNQPGFDPDSGSWTCTECGQTLYGDDIYDGDRFSGVMWYCDGCGSLLNKQSGFSDSYDTWCCTECGYENKISEDNIFESQQDYENNRNKTDEEDDDTFYLDKKYCEFCGALLNKQEGFEDFYDTWTCTRCWYENKLTDDDTTSDDMDFGSSDSDNNDDSDSNEDSNYSYDNDHSHDKDYGDDNDYKSDRENKSQSKTNFKEKKKSIKHSDEVVCTTSTFTKIKALKLPILIIGIEIIIFIVFGWKLEARYKFKELDIIALIFIVIGYISWKHAINNKLIEIGFSSEELKGYNYKEVIKKLKEAGFTEIRTRQLEDLSINELWNENNVESITINDSSTFSNTSKFMFDDLIRIKYHVLRRIHPPISAEEARKRDYLDIEKQFRDAGFVNIDFIVLYDIVTGWIIKDREVKKVTVQGNSTFKTNSLFRPDCKVVITYHTFKKYRML